MHFYLCVRAQSLTIAKAALAEAGAVIIRSQVDKIQPALRNLSEALVDRGMAWRLGETSFYWLEVEHKVIHLAQWLRFSCVELALDYQWLQTQLKLIRGLKGAAYVEAAYRWCKKFTLKSQSRPVHVQFQEPDCEEVTSLNEGEKDTPLVDADHTAVVETVVETVVEAIAETVPPSLAVGETVPLFTSELFSGELFADEKTHLTTKKSVSSNAKVNRSSSTSNHNVRHTGIPEQGYLPGLGKPKREFIKRTQAIREEQLDMFGK
ncbi:hypothetical protein [Marinibactrum halimedae]|uniref:Uncharacterized protein n=1 Tax=Marinibactrum halimedae TaxID=1444977 RepID=A0AA37TCF7_9GAMM|nr:hypothetical protein [Marinibactrum halimedae]MCD9460605.1 hypothetical protein [Marinibactrum halimedae]GLS27821.1 hypothetical protein GCM10007877_35400 [Marinibactrum halimedae]